MYVLCWHNRATGNHGHDPPSPDRVALLRVAAEGNARSPSIRHWVVEDSRFTGAEAPAEERRPSPAKVERLMERKHR